MGCRVAPKRPVHPDRGDGKRGFAAVVKPRKTSLVVQWMRIRPPMQGTGVQSLVGELRSHMSHLLAIYDDEEPRLIPVIATGKLRIISIANVGNKPDQ